MRVKLAALVCVLGVGLSINSYAQTSLDDQINAVAAVQQQQQAAAAAAAASAASARAAADAEAQRRADKQEAAAAASQKARQAAAAAERQRQDGYVDQLRSLEIQRQQLEIQAAKTRVDRENEYIDQELQQNAAQTDSIKASAEAERNISQGAKSYLEHAGTAPSPQSDATVTTK